jgi:hypothetical protein
VNEHGQATVQGVLLSDKIWFVLLADQKGFETLNRILLQQKRYSPKTSFDSAKSSPLNSDQARKEKIQGKVVVTVIINSVGQPAKIC